MYLKCESVHSLISICTLYLCKYMTTTHGTIFFFFQDDDSEPLLGQWFEETLAPREPQTTAPPPATVTKEAENANGKSQQPQQTTSESGSLIPDKGEPNGVSYIVLLALMFY